MTLAEQLYGMMQKSMAASQPTDYCTGTVTSADPLEITTAMSAAPLRRSVLILTEPVVEKKIPVLQHTHLDSRNGQTTAALKSVQAVEAGATLPVEGGYILLNRGLAVGDRVVLLRVLHGQKYLVLSRVFEEG